MTTTITIPKTLQYAANDLRQVRPTARDQKRNPDVMAIWRDDIEHTIRCKELSPEMAAAFRVACGA